MRFEPAVAAVCLGSDVYKHAYIPTLGNLTNLHCALIYLDIAASETANPPLAHAILIELRTHNLEDSVIATCHSFNLEVEFP